MRLAPRNCRYGAPMGRASYGLDTSERLYLSRVPLDAGGYDNGGAYWGHGLPIYAASDTSMGDTENSRTFATVRAIDRASAKAKLRAMMPNASFHR